MNTKTENLPITFQSEVAKEVAQRHGQLVAENQLLGEQLLTWKQKAEDTETLKSQIKLEQIRYVNLSVMVERYLDSHEGNAEGQKAYTDLETWRQNENRN